MGQGPQGPIGFCGGAGPAELTEDEVYAMLRHNILTTNAILTAAQAGDYRHSFYL